MDIQKYRSLNNIAGWLVFLFAAAVYTLTMESTASLWDCGEFIASSYKLQVVHPPGAPMFLMISRMFTLLAMGDPELVSLSVNFMSAICSGLAMMFLCWITTHMAKRVIEKSGEALNSVNVWVILGAGVIAGLTGTFVDSIWFSAVEAEVYSMSLLCTAIVFWSILKWEERASEPNADRWLLFTAFMIGCSIFVHWLNLLTIPAMTLVYYFRRYETSRKGIFLAFMVSIGILGFILSGIITGFVGVAAFLELTFVNEFGLPFNSGVIFFLLALVGSMAFGLWYTFKNNKPVLHNLMLGLMFVLIGYSSILTAVIRSNSNPNINMNSPVDVVSLHTYLKREQYGSRPFLTGYDYTADIVATEKVGTKWARGEKKYDDVGDRIDYVYKGKKMFFPRLHSSDPSHVQLYEQWLGLRKGKKPSYADNLRFFFKYQIGHMYVRYFMWNFVGKQNDDQGMGGRAEGNWISGIPPIDNMRLGPQGEITPAMKNHESRNTYFFLPLLLGLLGMVHHFTTDKKRASVVFLLFFFLGLAIIIQGNSPPIEPRERDYIFAGSFYAFVIWIGLGVVALYDILKNTKLKDNAAKLAPVFCLIVPIIMGFQGWDDHDRSGRFAARDFAANYLNSCAPNSIIFTQGDNDTYPLWYAQEVEGVRRDVRVVNLSLLGVDWYIEQLRRKVNDADPVPMTMGPDKIRGSKRDVVPYYEDESKVPKGKAVDLRNLMEFIGDDSRASKAAGRSGDMDYFPTRNFKFKVDKQKVLASGAISPEDQIRMVDELKWTLRSKSSLYKNDLMTLDIIAANNWERPIYFAISVSPGSYLGLDKYFQLEGLAYRLVPIESKAGGVYKGNVNTDIMYDILMNRFKFGQIDKEGTLVDSDLRRMIFNFRGNYARLAEQLIAEGDSKRAIEVLDRSQEGMPDSAAPYNLFMYTTVQNYYDAGDYTKANEVTSIVANRIADELKYYKSLPPSDRKSFKRDRDAGDNLLKMFISTAKEKKQFDFALELEELYESI